MAPDPEAAYSRSQTWTNQHSCRKRHRTWRAFIGPNSHAGVAHADSCRNWTAEARPNLGQSFLRADADDDFWPHREQDSVDLKAEHLCTYTGMYW
jgi:hypothetical protein